jgi:hypothetical protein
MATAAGHRAAAGRRFSPAGLNVDTIIAIDDVGCAPIAREADGAHAGDVTVLARRSN